MVESIVYLVQCWVMTDLARNMSYGVVLGYICVTKTPQQFACMSVGVRHVYGTSMDGRIDRLPCKWLGNDRYSATYVVRGCTRLHLSDQISSPAGIHVCNCYIYVRHKYGWSTGSFTLYKVG
jgi:hypothetical protein